MGVFVQVTTKKIDITEMIAKVKSDNHGAIDLFIGVVRNNHNGKTVTGITYDVHEQLTEKTFTDICFQAMKRWPETHYAVSHYKGELPVGGASIVIAVSSVHRAESFEACRYIINEIKKYAPIWKQEHYLDGKSDWLPGHSLRQETECPDIDCTQSCEEQYG